MADIGKNDSTEQMKTSEAITGIRLTTLAGMGNSEAQQTAPSRIINSMSYPSNYMHS